MRRRTRARELALKALYLSEVRRRAGWTDAEDGDPLQLLPEAGSVPAPESTAYARWLVDGVLLHREDLDRRIAAAASNWKLNRIALVDRSILRLALLELLESAEVPPKVAMDEAISLAKKYSTEQSGAFVNGILDRLARECLRLRENPC
jgi:N utilization substance protein B